MLDFLFELGQLKRVKRSGWWLLGIKEPESVAEHSFRAAALGYLLALEEGVDDRAVTLMCLFNDMHEARINDLHKVGHRYIDFKKAESLAFHEQTERMPKKAAAELKSFHDQLQSQETRESIVARDADLLECALQAREYIVDGHPDAEDWIRNIEKLLVTKSAKNLMSEIKVSDPNKWWKGLKKTER
jgi:putative hydrolase of HD superfamily